LIFKGILANIRYTETLDEMFKRLGKPIRFFDISKLPKEVEEISKDELIFEDEVKEFADSI
jgi:predicted fused transcriptional regulator/phosphomethylpyrimidine kinase